MKVGQTYNELKKSDHVGAGKDAAQVLHGHLHQYANATRKSLYHHALAEASHKASVASHQRVENARGIVMNLSESPMVAHHRAEGHRHNGNATRHLEDAERVGKKLGFDQEAVHAMADHYVNLQKEHGVT
jgi:hypothetical protein